jgi:hypothetical protein
MIKAEEYRTGKSELLRYFAKTNPELVTLDEEGNPEYIEEKHGQHALIVFRIDRQGRECGQV